MKWRCSLFFVLLNQLRSAQTFFKRLPVTFSPIVSIFDVKTDNGETKNLFLIPISTFLIAAAILYTTFVPSLSLEEADHGEKTYNREHVWVKPRRGIIAQERALTFETPFFDGAQGIIAMILALLEDTIQFSRRVIDIQKYDPRQKKKQKITARTDRRFQKPRGVAIGVCMRLNVFSAIVLRVSRGF